MNLRFSKVVDDGGSRDLVAGDFAGEREVLMVLLPPDESPPSEEYYTGTALLDTRSGYSINCASEKKGNFEKIADAFYGAGGLGADYPGRTVPKGYLGESTTAFNGPDETRNYDAADLPMELSHGKTDSWKDPLGYLYTVNEKRQSRLYLRQILVGRNDAEWAILQSCLLFANLDPIAKPSLMQAAWGQLGELELANGIHVLLGFVTLGHTDCRDKSCKAYIPPDYPEPPTGQLRIQMDLRFAEFAQRLKNGDPIQKAWREVMIIDYHDYEDVRGKLHRKVRVRPVAIGSVRPDERGHKGWNDILPFGPDVREISADMRTRDWYDVKLDWGRFPPEE